MPLVLKIQDPLYTIMSVYRVTARNSSTAPRVPFRAVTRCNKYPTIHFQYHPKNWYVKLSFTYLQDGEIVAEIADGSEISSYFALRLVNGFFKSKMPRNL